MRTEQDRYDQQQIGARLKEAREFLGLSQEQVADALRVGRTAMVAIEQGTRKVYANELARFGKLYRRPVAWLLGNEPEPELPGGFTATVGQLCEQDQHALKQFALFLAHAGAPAPRGGKGVMMGGDGADGYALVLTHLADPKESGQ